MIKSIKKVIFSALIIISGSAHAGFIGNVWDSGGNIVSGVFGTGATVSWSLMDSGISCAGEFEDPSCETVSLYDFMPIGFKFEIERAFNAWSSVANITFTETTDSGTSLEAPGSQGNIRVGGHLFDGLFGILAHGYFPFDGFPASGDIHFDIEDTWKIGFGGVGFDIFQVMAHEIGHAIGIRHSLEGILLPDLPDLPSLMDPFYTETFSGPQPNDIAYAQFLYGAPIATNVSAPTTLSLFLLAAIGLSFRSRSKKTIRSNLCVA